MGTRFTDELEGSAAATVLLHATVTDLRLAPGTARVAVAEVRGLGDRVFAVEADRFVLAAGGIENPRLLLASRSDRASGLGNERGAVGRYFMEHLHTEVGVVVDAGPDLRTPFFDWSGHVPLGRGALAGTAAAQRAWRLLPISITVMPHRNQFGQRGMHAPPELSVPAQRFLRNLPTTPQRVYGGVVRARHRVVAAARGLSARAAVRWSGDIGRAADVRFVHARSEQVPHRDCVSC